MQKLLKKLVLVTLVIVTIIMPIYIILKPLFPEDPYARIKIQELDRVLFVNDVGNILTKKEEIDLNENGRIYYEESEIAVYIIIVESCKRQDIDLMVKKMAQQYGAILSEESQYTIFLLVEKNSNNSAIISTSASSDEELNFINNKLKGYNYERVKNYFNEFTPYLSFCLIQKDLTEMIKDPILFERRDRFYKNSHN